MSTSLKTIRKPASNKQDTASEDYFTQLDINKVEPSQETGSVSSEGFSYEGIPAGNTHYFVKYLFGEQVL